MAELSASLTDRLIEVLDCTVTLRRGIEDRVSEVRIAVSTGWDARAVGASDRGLLGRQLHGAPDAEGWHTAQVAALHGQVFDLSDPDLVDQADEISEVSLAIATGLPDDGDTVLALEVAEWYPPFDSIPLVDASLGLTGRVLSRLCDRLAYLLGEHLRLVGAAGTGPPALERPLGWWQPRGWVEAGDGIVIRDWRAT